MQIRFIIIAIFFSASISVWSQDTNFHIYICFGQSNMEGTGPIEAQDTLVDDRFQVFQSLDCPDLGRQKHNWYTATPPLCNCYSGLSPVDYFGRTMVENMPDSIRIGVLNVAVGGCDIRLFDKDIYEDYDSTYSEDWFTKKVAWYNGNPYNHLISLAKKAQKDGVIKGILLHQGETNTGDSLWPTYVEKIYTDLINDLTLDSSTPIIAGEVVSIGENCCASMNPIINQLPTFIPTAHIVSSEGLTSQDKAHFDAAGYRTFGKRYAETMLGILK